MLLLMLFALIAGLLYALGGRAVLERVRRRARGQVVERPLGTILLLTGVLMAASVDVRFEEALARDTNLPSFLVDPTRSLESSHAVQSRLAALRPASHFAARRAAAPSRSSLPRLGAAPGFTGTQRWFNTTGGRSLTLAGLHGHVVLVDFWTYTCINCLRTQPFLKGLYATHHGYGLEIVGVQTPEFTFEQDAGTSPRRSGPTACATRWSRTTGTGPGTRTAISTGRPST